jgi:hypothetical protein
MPAFFLNTLDRNVFLLVDVVLQKPHKKCQLRPTSVTGDQMRFRGDLDSRIQYSRQVISQYFISQAIAVIL